MILMTSKWSNTKSQSSYRFMMDQKLPEKANASNSKMQGSSSISTEHNSHNHESGAENSEEEGMFKTPGQYDRDGVTFPGSVSPKALDWLHDSFCFRPDDILIISFPKSGSTWLQLIIHLVLNKQEIHQREPSSEVQRLAYFLEGMTRSGATPKLNKIDELPCPRIIKSHLQYRHLQKAIERGIPRIVVILRNPKDTLVSMYNFYRMYAVLGCFQGTWNDFFSMILKKKIVYGSWFDHTKGWLQLQEHPKVLFLYFEDMKEDPATSVKSLCQFFNQTLTESEVLKIVEMTKFHNMKASPKTSMTNIPGFNNSISQFLRKGEVADWKNFFTVSQNEYFDALYATEMKDCDINIRFEM